MKKMSFEALGLLQAPKGVFGGPILGLNSTKSWKTPIVTYQIKGFGSLINIMKQKMSFGALGLPQGPKCIFKGPVGVNYSKSQNLHCVTYQNKGFDSLINKKMRKISFGVLAPL